LNYLYRRSAGFSGKLNVAQGGFSLRRKASDKFSLPEITKVEDARLFQRCNCSSSDGIGGQNIERHAVARGSLAQACFESVKVIMHPKVRPNTRVLFSFERLDKSEEKQAKNHDGKTTQTVLHFGLAFRFSNFTF